MFISLIKIATLLIYLNNVHLCGASLPDAANLDFELSQENSQLLFPITLNSGTRVYLRILCESGNPSGSSVELKYKFTERICKENASQADPEFFQSEKHECNHGGPIIPDKIVFQEEGSKKNVSTIANTNDNYLLKIFKDGIYILELQMKSSDSFNASVNIKFQSPNGLLTAKDEKLLGFYAAMCCFYFLLATVWMVFSALHFNSLLRIQFCIGAVILLGMLEKACFYFEYFQANDQGSASISLALIAELVSCVKRTLSRILVLIVSMGFGITKSRLGDEANVRISVVSILYFSMASIESYLRLIQTHDRVESKQLILAAVPLALLDSLICWWCLTSLIQTIRALRLRRNVVKLQFYEHFKNVLIFGVTMSVIFMIYSIQIHKVTECAWKNLWIDQAFWHVLFSILLTVISFLWRPNQNNQKYAFTPLLEEDDEHEEFVSSNTFSDTKFRTKGQHHPQKHEEREEDPELKWVEENIVSTSLLADSDEELIHSKFEISKMQ